MQIQVKQSYKRKNISSLYRFPFVYSKRPNIGPADYWSLTLHACRQAGQSTRLQAGGIQAMATTRIFESNGGVIYTCEECCKSFNRLASYKAHVRTHAGNEQDGLDLVSKKICQETSSSVERRETRCKTRRSSGTAGERARVVEEPHRVQSQVSAVADVRQVADRQSSAVSSNGDVGSSLQSSGQG